MHYNLCKRLIRHSWVMYTTVFMLQLSSSGCKSPALIPLAFLTADSRSHAVPLEVCGSDP